MVNSPSPSRLPNTSRYAAVLLGIVGTAAGLNLTVMNIGARPIDATPEIASPATLGDPEVRQVVVDVPVPVREVDPSVSSAADASAALAAAAPVPVAPVAPSAPASTPSAPAPVPAPVPIAPASTAPTSTAPASSSAPATAAPPSTTAATPSTAPSSVPAPTTEYLAYGFDGVAEIVVAFHDGQRLEFWSATPEEGWAYMVEKNRANKIEVEFRRVSGGEGEAKFELILEDGELEVKKER